MMSALASIVFHNNHRGSDGYYREYVNPLFVRFSDAEDIVYSGILSDKSIPDLFLFDKEYQLLCRFPGIDTKTNSMLHIVDNYPYEIVAGNIVIGSLSLILYEIEGV